MKKTIQHYRTSALEYININFSNIPNSQNITRLDSLPTSEEIYHMVEPPKYILIPSTGLYYELRGKRPNPDMLSYGEISISFKENYEGIFFKNSSDNIVEIPVNNKHNNTTGICKFINPFIEYTQNQECYIWSIPFEEIASYNINVNLCSFSIRNLTTGTQALASFTMNYINQCVDIPINDESIDGLSANSYMVICIGEFL